MKTVLIGAGNVATQLGIALKDKGFPIVQVYSRTLQAAQALAGKLQANYTHQLPNIDREADLYLFAVKDAALPEIINTFPPVAGLCVHTAGSVPMDVFKNSAVARYGVFYPLQTFDKNRPVSFESVPIFTEANSMEDEHRLETLALTLSGKVTPLSSEKRKYLHLAAVFACNFTNHLYNIAAQILEKQNIDWNVLLPLIEETAAKVRTLPPRDAQTGPAVRRDKPVIEKHLEMLGDDPAKQEIYRVLSRDIQH
jgi:predicted short-subunit dehydrogenase-like oxidoreductase (DUF2520 family)